MLMPDVNILVYAHREDEQWHRPYAKWLKNTIDGVEPFALSVLVAVGFVRIVTNRRIYENPTPLPIALAAIEQIMNHPRCRLAAPSTTHLGDVMRLCRAVGATGKLVADAQHAALALSQGSTWVTRDGDFARFEPHGLRWQHLVLA
jgi:toxin-antitoxin system PIN domain toxin